MEDQQWDVVIVANEKKVKVDWKGLRNSRDLIFLWVRRNFVSRYKQTVLGPAWALIQPFFTTVVFSLVFGDIAGLGAQGVPNFVFYLSGTVIWTLFSQSLIQNAGTFVSNAGIMGKVYFPRLVMPIATAISQFITFAIQFAFLILAIVFFVIFGEGVHPNWYALFLPLILIQVSVLGTGIGIIVSSLTTKYRDLSMTVGFFVSLWQYASPIAYDMFGRRSLYERRLAYYFYMLNPITPPINMFRYGFIGTGEIDWLYYGISLVTTAVIAMIGVHMFSKVEKTFMDTV
ncbi:MAG: ABC transporter permease [Clostridia bacterium]|nr:ABC transporter permease [Clostridia bacterium]MBR0510492.1 ABC transporter permease [Clostridia bacterium]MBR0537867.1 ABC transporter permease [Clostridia bacterium]